MGEWPFYHFYFMNLTLSFCEQPRTWNTSKLCDRTAGEINTISGSSVVLLLAADFWTVKNITGRLMVGLRWWNKVNEDGTTEWVFESRKEGSAAYHSETENRIFWSAMFISSLFWIILLIKNLLGLSLAWMVVCLTGVGFHQLRYLDKSRKYELIAHTKNSGWYSVPTIYILQIAWNC